MWCGGGAGVWGRSRGLCCGGGAGVCAVTKRQFSVVSKIGNFGVLHYLGGYKRLECSAGYVHVTFPVKVQCVYHPPKKVCTTHT